MNRPDRTPVLVGIGVATRREEDHTRALEPMDLMLEAVRAAGADSGCASTLRGLQYIAVPRGRWSYANPAGEIARAVGASNAVTVLSSVGVLQQTLIGEACSRIANGQAHTTLVTGADAGYRLLRAQIAGAQAPERVQTDAPDVYLSPADELRHPAEKRAGLKMPVGMYAIMESAFRARRGWSIERHRDELASIVERFSRVAVDNPHAWTRRVVEAADVREASPRNPMQAFPYAKLHCSSWNVDQAAALLFCSAARAQELGIPRSQWIYPRASTESNHMVAMSARACLDECPGARIAGQAALNAAGLRAADIDLIDLYSCFPLAVQTYADALGLPIGGQLTITGGMNFAGGPYNNYVFQATCRAAELMRQGRGRSALISCVSGILTKQAFGIWSVDEGSGYTCLDVSDQVEREVETLDVLEHYSGPATIAGFTVLHGRDQPPRGVAVVDTVNKGDKSRCQRATATTEDAAWITRMQHEELVGHPVHIQANELVA